ncbi:MAG: hypothetical protein AAB911_01360 [Patescibacteria group bacterium]
MDGNKHSASKSEELINKFESNTVASLKDIPAILFTFILVLFGWIFFRANTINEAFYVVKKIALEFNLFNIGTIYPKRLFIIAGFIVVEWIQRRKEHPLQIDDYPSWLRWLIYYLVVAVILLFGVYNYNPFIYFQF